MLNELESAGRWDLIVIGGGATGLGIAVDASARGYNTLLLEAHDFASSTSSRSTKLIHGGLRYLRQGNLWLVRDALHERSLLLKNAPGLVRPLPFVIPHRHWRDRAIYGMGVQFYDTLAGPTKIKASRHLTKAETLEQVPDLQEKEICGGTLYFDAQFDDARLAVALARTAADLGATLINYLPVTGLLKGRNGKANGVTARNAETGAEYEIHAKAIINATGVFADSVRTMDKPKAPALLRPSRGTHVVLDRTFFSGDTALLIPSTDDGRVLFAIPWHERVLVGTTDVPAPEISPDPRASEAEIEYLLRHAALYLRRAPARTDVLSAFAGLRPLVHGGARHTASLSRDHLIQTSDSGLITVTGGKWTTFRKMAENSVDETIRQRLLESRPCRTAHLHLHETPATAGKPLHPRLRYTSEDIVRAAHSEMAQTVEDALARRTRALFLDARAATEMAPRVAELMARELGCDSTWQEQQVAAFRARAAEYL